MDTKQEESVIDGSMRQRKFGLPDWMVNNIERLNFVTDFEQYACSPPETEGFLADYKEGLDMPLPSEPYCPVVEPKAVQNVSIKNVIQVNVEKESKPAKLIINPVDQLPAIHHSLSSIKNEELFSSPDSTPCATPEPSPVVRRKMSNPTDTVITNPGRWFYLGKVNNLQRNIKESDLKNKENKIKCGERSPIISANPNDSLLDARKNGIKLMISNFDLNAVSPTSW